MEGLKQILITISLITLFLFSGCEQRENNNNTPYNIIFNGETEIEEYCTLNGDICFYNHMPPYQEGVKILYVFNK